MLRFLAKGIRENLRLQANRWRVWKKFGFFLPKSSILFPAKAIQIGKGFACGPFCQIYCQTLGKQSELVIGDRVALNSNVMINADNGGKIVIGNCVIVGPNVVLRASNHSFHKKEIPIREQDHEAGIIIIEDDVWLGSGVVVLPNVRIGRGSVIGAGSVVTKDIPPFSVAVGVPAHVIHSRGQEEKI